LLGTSAFCLGHNPTNIRVRTQLTNAKISWINIQFASSKLTAVIRGSSPGCRVDKDTLVNPVQQRDRKKEGKENISKYKKAIAVEEEDKTRMYLQQQQTSCETAQPWLAGDALC
jgi:hypothetical protein